MTDEAQAALQYVQATGQTHQTEAGVTLYWSAYYQQWCTWEFIWATYAQYGKR